MIDIDSVQTRCGYGVPSMSLQGERDTLFKYHGTTVPETWELKAASRTTSIDGLLTRASKQYISGDS